MVKVKASKKVATIAPINPTLKGKLGHRKATNKQTAKKVALPSKVLFLILIRPNFLPTKAAAMSPRQ